jgi:hypothetical protein
MVTLSLPGLLIIILGFTYLIGSTFGLNAGKLLFRLTFLPMPLLFLSFVRELTHAKEPGWVYFGYSAVALYCLAMSGASALGLYLARRSNSGSKKAGLGLNPSDS